MPKPQQDIGVAIIGYGYWGPNLARCFAETDGCRVAAIVDASPAALARAAKRHPAAPEVPTTVEAGVKYYYDGGWFGMFAPARTPAEVVEVLAREVRTAMQKPQVRERMAALGVEPAAGTPAEFRKFVTSELRAYGEMVRLAGVQPE